jgi:hypothetical protein
MIWKTEKSERNVQNEITGFLDLFPARCRYRTNSEAYNKFRTTKRPVGYPDISGDWDGVALYIEVKKRGGIASKEQFDFILDAKKRKCIAMIVDNLNDVVKVLNSMESNI